jgi:hypothetical protein
MPGVSRQFEAYMLQHHYIAARLDRDDRTYNVQTVDVKINGQKLTFFVDSGTPQTILTVGCARDLHLDVHNTGRVDSGVDGVIQGNEGTALIQSFIMGNSEINRTNTVAIFPKGAHVRGGLGGVLGLDYMRLNAVVYPVGGTGFLLKPGPTPAVSIAAFMGQLGYTAVPLSFRAGHLIVNGHINGHPISAIVDTGAAFSMFDSVFVRGVLGHAIPSLPMALSGFDGKVADEYRFTPSEFDVDGFKIPPVMLVSSNAAMFAKDGGITGLLGVDLLGTHRAIIDMGRDTLWLK